LEREEGLKAIEAVLFVSDSPVTLEHLREVLETFSKEEVREMVADLERKFEDHGLQIMEIAEGFQIRTRPECGEWVKKYHKLSRSTKLSQAALETLSMIAYRQPITRQEIEDIRGVDSSGVLKNLLDKNLVKSLGRKRVPGKPVTFGTTKKFLEYFGLVKLSDLPTLKDLPTDESTGMQEQLAFNQLMENRPEEHEIIVDDESEESGDLNESEFNEDTADEPMGAGNGDENADEKNRQDKTSENSR
jgi:segregation and condensation protein B